MLNRRTFLASIPSLALAMAADARALRPAARRHGDHPTPRPNIDASKVLRSEDLADHPGVIPLFDSVRAIPQVVDGIRCYCGCDERPDSYSLLSCYEDGMAKHCYVCQGEGGLVARMHGEGKTLEEIRAAIDLEFGD
jgi:hypothetical protein